MINKPKLDSKITAGVVGQPEYAEGSTFIKDYQPNMTDSGTQINITASSENRSAKWRRPQPHDIPAEAANQYE